MVLMIKKIITAIGNNILNDSLKQIGEYEVIGNDIQYKEGILEFLNERNDIDILIISEILDGEIDFKQLILDILKINSDIDIVVFIEKENKDLRNYLYEKGIYKIYLNNELDIDELILVLENETSQNTEALSNEIKRLKQIIEEQKININNNSKHGRIIAITGSYGSRKKYFILYLMQTVCQIK